MHSPLWKICKLVELDFLLFCAFLIVAVFCIVQFYFSGPTYTDVSRCERLVYFELGDWDCICDALLCADDYDDFVLQRKYVHERERERQRDINAGSPSMAIDCIFCVCFAYRLKPMCGPIMHAILCHRRPFLYLVITLVVCARIECRLHRMCGKRVWNKAPGDFDNDAHRKLKPPIAVLRLMACARFYFQTWMCGWVCATECIKCAYARLICSGFPSLLLLFLFSFFFFFLSVDSLSSSDWMPGQMQIRSIYFISNNLSVFRFGFVASDGTANAELRVHKTESGLHLALCSSLWPFNLRMDLRWTADTASCTSITGNIFVSNDSNGSVFMFAVSKRRRSRQ